MSSISEDSDMFVLKQRRFRINKNTRLWGITTQGLGEKVGLIAPCPLNLSRPQAVICFESDGRLVVSELGFIELTRLRSFLS